MADDLGEVEERVLKTMFMESALNPSLEHLLRPIVTIRSSYCAYCHSTMTTERCKNCGSTKRMTK